MLPDLWHSEALTMNEWKTKNGTKITLLLGGRSNVFLLSHNKKHILIDTSPQRLFRKLNRRLVKMDINHIDYLILTHTHFDHTGNAFAIKRRYKAKVFVHKNEAGNLIKGQSTLPAGTNRFTRLITRLVPEKIAAGIKTESCDYDYTIDSSYDLSGLGFNAYIMHTPGHTSGSVSVIIDDEIALVGDTMFGIFRSSVFPPFADNIPELIRSWKSLLETECSLFLPSHGREKTREELNTCLNEKKSLLQLI